MKMQTTIRLRSELSVLYHRYFVSTALKEILEGCIFSSSSLGPVSLRSIR